MNNQHILFKNRCFMTEEVMTSIVISGISGRFPDSDNVDQFWENLVSGTFIELDRSQSRYDEGRYKH